MTKALNKILLCLARSKKIPCALRIFSLLKNLHPTIIAPILVNKRTTNSSIIIDQISCIIQSCILYEGSYEPELSEIFLGSVNSQDSFLDIGSNIGYYSVLAIGANLKSICAVEPSKEIFDSLLKNLKYNFFASNTSVILPFNLGFSDTCQLLNFIPPKSGNLGVGRFIDIDHKDTLPSRSLVLPVVPGDQVIASLPFRPTVIKIDVEGFEFKVLMGMKNFLRSANKPRLIFIETSFSYWENEDHQCSPLSLLSTFGYRIKHIKRRNGLIEKYENFLAYL